MKFQETYYDIDEIISENDSVLIICGAGISVDPPSNIPTAKDFIRIFYDLFLNKSDKNKIADLYSIKFETIVRIVRETIDPHQKFLEYFNLIKNTNHHHHFIAQHILQGNNVITMNFDNLIEKALIESIKSEYIPKIKPIITQQDFSRAYNAVFAPEKGDLMLYKYHGALKNEINGESTKNTVIIEDTQFHRTNTALNPNFEACKEKILNKLLKKADTILFMGYSGSDYFDLIPNLAKNITNQKIIWIFHKSANNSYLIYELEQPEKNKSQNYNTSTSINFDEFLTELKRIHPKIEIYKIIGDTIKIAEDLERSGYFTNLRFSNYVKYSIFYELSEIPDFKSWYSKKIKPTPQEKKHFTKKIFEYF